MGDDRSSRFTYASRDASSENASGSTGVGKTPSDANSTSRAIAGRNDSSEAGNIERAEQQSEPGHPGQSGNARAARLTAGKAPSTGRNMALPLASVLDLLEDIAPLEHAESWDNVGLLLEPASDRRDPAAPPSVSRALATIDLTDAVFAEALASDVDLIVSYHPPWFQP